MANTVQNKFNKIMEDGARASKFDVDVIFNNDLYNDPDTVSFLAKTSTFPGKTHEVIDFRYKGRTIPIKGQTKYTQTWECTFYLTPDHALKNAFETWIESIDQKHNYHEVSEIPKLGSTQAGNESIYVTNIMVYQKDYDGLENLATYEIINAFPISVSQAEMNAESIGTISEFTVTFAYSHYKSTPAGGGGGGSAPNPITAFKEAASTAPTPQPPAAPSANSVIDQIMGGVTPMVSSFLDAID